MLERGLGWAGLRLRGLGFSWSLGRGWEADGLRIRIDPPPTLIGSDILYPKDSSSPHSGVPAEVLCRGRDFVVSAQALTSGVGVKVVVGGRWAQLTAIKTLAGAASRGQVRVARAGLGALDSAFLLPRNPGVPASHEPLSSSPEIANRSLAGGFWPRSTFHLA